MLDSILKGFTKLFGSKSDRDLKKINPIVEQINAIAESLKEISDDELKQKTEFFKEDVRKAVAEIDADILGIRDKLDADAQDGGLSYEERHDLVNEYEELQKEWLEVIEGKLDELLPEAFATLKETCRRFVGKTWDVAGSPVQWDMVPYDVQLAGAVVLHQGKIAEMKTGEGKTLVAIFPAYLNGLVGRGVHVITVNDYLAKRDAEWNKPIFEFHGLKVDCIDKYEPNSEERRQAYRCDVTYGTNNEFGFDYLRDNMAASEDMLVQRGHHYAIVDEVDSVLIDEARTPLIISGPVPFDNQNQKYVELKPRVDALVQAQKKLAASLVAEFEKKLSEDDKDAAGLALFRAHRGFPKNRKLQKLLQETTNQKLLQQTEYFYLQDNAKNMQLVDDALYFSVDFKMKTIELQDMGRDFITGKDEDPDFFVIPDMGHETAVLEEEIVQQRKREIAEIEQNSEFSAAYKSDKIAEKEEELRKYKIKCQNDLNRLFAERSERIHSVNQLLKAYTLFERDDEYILQDGKVQIVDEHTGRVLPGRRYSDGLHQAIEAKENVKVEAATQTYATVTLQNYFRLYHKLAGMTGTAITEEGEFFEIYKLEVIEIPTNRPIARVDHDDIIYMTKKDKYGAIMDRIREYNEKGQPVLVGTTSVEVSETLSRMLKRSGIKHNVLNAKQHKKESEIVAEAGKPGGVTIATNMAGRGTDIKIGKEVIQQGGLAILGTERHDSRRIDLQLRGRSGRQGDPGESQFFVSMEDNLMKYFASDRVVSMMEKATADDGGVIQHPWFTKALERAQKRVEQNNFGIRKRQLEFDDVLNNQRKVIYTRRNHALKGEQLTDDLADMLEDLVIDLVDAHFGNMELEHIQEEVMRLLAVNLEFDKEKWASLGANGLSAWILEEVREAYRQKEKIITEPFFNALQQIDQAESQFKPKNIQVIFTDGIRRMRVVVNFEKALQTQGRELFRALERSAVLSIIDEKWMEHLRELDALKEGIGLRAFGQKDPLLEYKREAFNMFSELVRDINHEVITLIWKAAPETNADQNNLRKEAAPKKAGVDLKKAQVKHQDPKLAMDFAGNGNGRNRQIQSSTNAGGDAPKQEPIVVGEKVGRNDPCPCGSGKKYKQCHGKNG